ncbi:hypothetical protein Tco_0292499 [Tanacetum coccineum]
MNIFMRMTHPGIPEVIAQNEPASPHTEVVEGPPDLVNTKGTNEQNIQDEQIITQPFDSTSGNNTKVLVPTIEPSVPEIHQSQLSHQAFISYYLVGQDRWSKDQHIELINIISDPSEGMLTRSMLPSFQLP